MADNFCGHCGRNSSKDDDVEIDGFRIVYGGEVYYKGVLLDKLSKTQKSILHSLAAKAPQPVSNDALVMRCLREGVGEGALRSHIHRIRDVLKEYGISNPIAQCGESAAYPSGYAWRFVNSSRGLADLVMAPDLVSEDQLVAHLRSLLDERVNLDFLAASFGVCVLDMANTLASITPISDKIASAAGYRKVVVYRKKKIVTTKRGKELWDLSGKVRSFKEKNGLTIAAMAKEIGISDIQLTNVMYCVSGKEEIRNKISKYLSERVTK